MAGTLLIWGTLGFVGYSLGWTLHSDRGGQTLVGAAKAKLASADRKGTGCKAQPPAPGQVAGVLSIPDLGLTAPVEQGISNTVLQTSVGHAPQSVWPGAPGTAVLLAHDVSYFADADKLVPGDLISFRGLPEGCQTVTFEVTGHQVVPAGSAIPGSATPSLVLDTCWPLDALWYTPNRYLVRAVEVGATQTPIQTSPAVSAGPQARTGSARRSEPQVITAGSGTLWQLPSSTHYVVPAPSALVAQGLSLVDNETPMGALALLGSPSTAWTESPQPLDLQTAALQEYFGALHSAAQDQQGWWADLAPGVAMPAALQGASVAEHYSGLDVSETISGNTPDAVQLSTVVGLSGGAAPGRYSMSVTETVRGSELIITSWSLLPS